ncbi:hypothetical protein B0J13DRAFT_98912 [Dactylonectria estremocensis]|uniref:Secreted protein n=1 Tax=Dactylonectria estremocensis TaxID=1079267 RepID=A0A9P9IV02_9HYPO|nr:hypothetical protein B0J13DRAFT_98912 [Dactylonectria estremocensis]
MCLLAKWMWLSTSLLSMTYPRERGIRPRPSAVGLCRRARGHMKSNPRENGGGWGMTMTLLRCDARTALSDCMSSSMPPYK